MLELVKLSFTISWDFYSNFLLLAYSVVKKGHKMRLFLVQTDLTFYNSSRSIKEIKRENKFVQVIRYER